jgi:Tfp pilus assembly protein PilO
MSNPTTLRERLNSPLTWHYAGLVVLVVAVGALGVRFGMDWSTTHGDASSQIAGKQLQLKALDMQTAPLRGLDKRVEESRNQMRTFYKKRIPANYSSFATRIGDLQVKSGVRLSRLLYTQGASSGDLTEISLDAGISGDYPQIMRFINGLERDQNFFVVRAMSLTGQQGGMVNLRLRVSTWMRAADAANSGLPQTQNAPADATAAPVTGKGGE